MNISHVTPKPDFTLLIQSEEGLSGIFDVRPYLDLEVFRQLKESDEFFKVHNGGYFVEWNCGADLSADTIFSKLQSCPTNIAQLSAPRDTPQAVRP